MTTWGELAQTSQALLCQAEELCRTARELLHAGHLARASANATRCRLALLREQARRLTRGLPLAGA
jgi:hypothetical protein